MMYGRVLSTITHETETTCMYFWSLMSNYKLRERSLTSNCAKLMRRSSLRTRVLTKRISTHWNRTQPTPCGTLISMPAP